MVSQTLISWIQPNLPISIFPHEKICTENNYCTYIFISVKIIFNWIFEKIPTLPFSVNLTTFFSATFSFLSGGVISILERPFLRGDRCDVLWLLCVGTTDSPSLSLSSEADLNINVIMRWFIKLAYLSKSSKFTIWTIQALPNKLCW